jgi:hypothetical protein
MLICLHLTFKKIILHSQSVGKYANLKLFKGFFLTIRNTIQNLISTGRNISNPVDEITIILASSLALLLEITVFVSFIVYLATHWRMIFLAHLINSL